MGKEIVVLGSSFGGYHCAIKLRKLLCGNHKIRVISREENFTFMPSLPWVAAGWTAPESIRFNITGKLKSRGIGFIKDTIVKAEPEKNRVIGQQGEYNYDYLVAATGSELDFAAIPGMEPEKGYSHSIFSVEQALSAKAALAKTIESGSGSLVFGNAQGASCLGPVYEMAMMTDTLLRRIGKRGNFKISLFTNEPSLGHFGVGGFGSMTRMLEDEFADRSIEWHVNAEIGGITAENVELKNGKKLKNDFSLIVPSFYGSHAYMGVDGLSNPRGFLLADDYLANPKYQNLFAVGVSLAIPPPAPTQVPVGVPKTGQMTEKMAAIAAHNIAADIKGGSKLKGKDFSVICIADAGDTAFFIAGTPLLPPRNRLLHKKGVHFHWLKYAFEKYYMASLKYGLPLPKA